MSGPKSSRYTLTAKQRRILQEQAERERKTKEEDSQIRRIISEMRIICEQLDTPLARANELNKRTGEAKVFVSSVEEERASVDKTIAKASAALGKQLEILEEERKILESSYKELKINHRAILAEAEIVTKKLNETLNADIDSGFTLSFKKAKRYTDTRSAPFLQTLTDFEIMPNLSPALKAEIANAKSSLAEITSPDFLQNFTAVTVTPLVKRCKQYLTDYEQHSDEFYALLAKYENLCEQQNTTQECYEFSVEAAKTLKTKISQLEKVAEYDREQSYIADTIDAVMTEMGYSVLGHRDVTKKSGRHFQSKLYSFDEGTAVNVTYASDGKITMELGGLSDEDRLPVSNEAAKLCDDMTEFCNGFTEIEKQLEKRGVVVKDRISILPPDEQYAQIINITEYNMRHEVQQISVKRGKTAINQTARREI